MASPTHRQTLGRKENIAVPVRGAFVRAVQVRVRMEVVLPWLGAEALPTGQMVRWILR
jgi:hypothetical protein